jgi:SAM-dependent methyltransferase
MGYDVLGVDIEPRMIALAKRKLRAGRNLRLDFRCTDISRVTEKGFQLAVSLFNVVNYVQDTERLFAFFQSIRERLIRGGIFIFDVWNGVAAMRELPGTREKVITLDHETLHCTVEATTDLMEQKTVLRYSVRVCGRGKDRRFEHEMEHLLWTPKCLRDLLRMAHLDTLEVLPFMQRDREAGPSDWKITFVARRP